MTQQLPFAPVDPAPTIELHHGDCLETMPTLAAGGVSMVFADLPYGLPSTSMEWDIPINLDVFWQIILRLNKNVNFLFTATQPFSSMLVTSRLKTFRYSLIWQKNIATNFFNAKSQPLRAYEEILVFGSASSTYNPQMRTGFKPYSGVKKIERSKQFNASNRKPRTFGSLKGDRYPINIIHFDVPSSRERLHPTQKPAALLEWLIKTYTNPGDTVLDPCFGSATTGVACLRTGRNFIGIEKDMGYFEIGRKRIAEEQARLGYDVTV